jgi:hypothetical protein
MTSDDVLRRFLDGPGVSSPSSLPMRVKSEVSRLRLFAEASLGRACSLEKGFCCGEGSSGGQNNLNELNGPTDNVADDHRGSCEVLNSVGIATAPNHPHRDVELMIPNLDGLEFISSDRFVLHARGTTSDFSCALFSVTYPTNELHLRTDQLELFHIVCGGLHSLGFDVRL